MLAVLSFLPVVLRNLCFLSSLPEPCDYKELICKERTQDMAKRKKYM